MELIRMYAADIWLVIIGFFLLYYAVTDGFDLGVGVLSLFAKDDDECALMMTTLENTWHDHQTWLLLLGGMVFGAFPLFYGIVLSSLYIPILLMVFGLMFRGVAFEFRSLSARKRLWSLSFGLGSLIVSVAQGFALGGLFSGLHVEGGQFAGAPWEFVNPYSLLVASGLIFGYVMLGANYLILKTEGEIQAKSYRWSLAASICTLAVSAGVHVWTLRMYPRMAAAWHSYPKNVFIAGFLLLTALSVVMFLRSLHLRREKAPLAWNALIILFSFVGISIGMYPDMIPNFRTAPVTVQAAAASPDTLVFMLGATVVLLPVILVYTGYKQRVFRGKTGKADYGEA